MPRFVFEPGVSDKRISQNLATPIWRYQDVPKLLWMLTTGSLWFARADTLEDRYEGSTTRALQSVYARELQEVLGDEPSFAGDTLQFISRLSRETVKNNVVNCWHMGEYESAAMWKLYVAAGQGVAIRSSIDRLLRCFPIGKASHPTDGSAGIHPRADTSNRDERGVSDVIAIDFGPVSYIDYKAPNAISRGPRSEYFRKRKSFEHERECRALIFALAVDGQGRVDLSVPVFPNGGVAVPADIDVLIEAIHVSPGAPRWFKQVIEAVVTQCGRNYPVVQSHLDEDPIF